MKQYALSLKQPWATLLAHGIKTVEVRRWPTRRRGPILIHAARIPDERPEAWAMLDAHLHLLEEARLLGGFVGEGDLWQCLAYRNAAAFDCDRARHLNDPSWFTPPMYGFAFRNLCPLAFRPYPGWMRFFEVPEEG